MSFRDENLEFDGLGGGKFEFESFVGTGSYEDMASQE